MHTIVHTQAIVLNSYPAGENNKSIILFTKELGIVYARAQGVRNSDAKLSGHLIDYSLINVDLVKGRSFWRLLSAKTIINPGMEKVGNLQLRSYIRMLGLIERFLVEGLVEQNLFNHAWDVASIIGEIEVDQKIFDAVVLWKCLVLLGYVAVEKEVISRFDLPIKDLLNKTDNQSATFFIKTANVAIQQSHL